MGRFMVHRYEVVSPKVEHVGSLIIPGCCHGIKLLLVHNLEHKPMLRIEGGLIWSVGSWFFVMATQVGEFFGCRQMISGRSISPLIDFNGFGWQKGSISLHIYIIPLRCLHYLTSCSPCTVEFVLCKQKPRDHCVGAQTFGPALSETHMFHFLQRPI